MTQQRIFVTVGSTDFTPLVKAVDAIAPTLTAEGVIQIGHGMYEPRNWPFFRFAPSLEPHYEQASLVVAHGGLATTMEVLRRGIPLVSVSNLDRYDNHQDDLLATMAEEGYLVWCRQLDELGEAIKTAQTTTLLPYAEPDCKIHEAINDFLRLKA